MTSWVRAAKGGPDFASFAAGALGSWLAAHPTDATRLGEHQHDHVLDDPSRAAAAARASDVCAQLAGLDDLTSATTPVSLDERVDAEILRTTLRAELLELEQIDAAGWNPMVHNPGQALHQLSYPFAPAAQRLDAVLDRLALIPGYLAAARDRLGELSRVHTETAARQFDGTIALIETVVPRLAADAGSPGRADRLAETAADAVQAHRTWLDERIGGASHDPRLGTTLFSEKLALALDTDFDPARLLERAEQDLDRITADLTAAAGRFTGVAAPDGQIVRQVLDELAAEVATDETILALCREAFAETTAFVREQDLITVYEDVVEIIEMPELDRGVAGAYCRAVGALETAPMATQFAVSPTPAGWTDEQVRSYFRENNRHMLHDLTAHEAMPGHALQLMHANRHRAAVPLRAVFGSGTFIEGWAVYAEELLAARGYRSDVSQRAAAAVHLQQLKMQLRTTLNTILDVRFHCHDTTDGLDEHTALALMTERGFQEPSEARAKWRRVQLTSTQLCTYYVGYCEMRALVADVRRAQPDWTDRQVHDAILSVGSPPPRHVRTLLHLSG